MLKLYDYQQLCVDKIRESYKTGHRAPLLVVPTGGGKTVIFSDIARNVSERGKRANILVHRIELLEQTSKALVKSNVKHGLINPKYTPNLQAPVQVASVQTLVKRMLKFDLMPSLNIVDEAHHATAGTWKKILDQYPNALTLGVTATPIRTDGIGLGVEFGGIFDDLIIGPSVSELIERGFLVAPVVYADTTKIDLSGVKLTKKGDYNTEQLAGKVDKPHITGNAVAHYTRICPGTPAVVFCVSVAHAEHVANEFRAAGYRAFAVDGDTDPAERKRILGGLGNGTVDVVCSCDLISEGTDIPAIGCVILLRPTESLGLYLQQVGRGLRPCAGKDRAYILDHVGNVLKHGMPQEDRQWSLEGKKKSDRFTSYGAGVKVKQCPKCYACHEPAPNCPQCGHFYVVEVNELEERAGELEELTATDIAAIKIATQKAKKKEVAQARTLEDLEMIATARGYKSGWASHIYKSRPQPVSSDDEIL